VIKVTIRGLTQTETTLNGREIFSVNDVDGFGHSGTDDIEQITWADVVMSAMSFVRDTQDQTKQNAIGRAWTADQLILKADISYTDIINNLIFIGPFLANTAVRFLQALGCAMQVDMGQTWEVKFRHFRRDP
jgi:hypothetical protein